MFDLLTTPAAMPGFLRGFFMKKYTVIGTVLTVRTGIIGLSDKQAEIRKHCLEAVNAKKGVFKVIKETQFKKGEVVYLEGEQSKALLQEIADDEKLQKMAEEEKKAPKTGKASTSKKPSKSSEAEKSSENSSENSEEK
jgi:hypothetical protein